MASGIRIEYAPLLPPPPPKKMRLPQHPDCAKQVTSPAFSNNQFLGPYNNLIGCRSDNNPAGMQGARHPQHGFSLPNRNLSFFPGSFLRTPIIPEPGSGENKNSGQESEKSDSNNEKAAKFVLFGQPIHTEEQISSMSRSSDTVLNSSYDCNADKVGNTADGSGSHLNRNDASSWEGFQVETGHCKVFMQWEDFARTTDLSLLGSYEELYKKFSSMFGIKISDIRNRVVYRDTTGAVRRLGEEPYSSFVKTVGSLTILADSGSDNIGV